MCAFALHLGTAEMEKLEHRSVIRFLIKEGNGIKTIHDKMIAVYRDNVPSCFLIKIWSKRFRWGHHESIEDDL